MAANAPTATRPGSRNTIAAPVIVDFFLSGLGFYCVVPVLPTIIGILTRNPDPLLTGTALFTFTFAYKGGSLFCANTLQRLPVRTTTAGGLVIAGAGFLLLHGMTHPVGILACLVLAGLGVSANNISARVLVALTQAEPTARNTAFAYIQVAINVAAAVGPLAANLLLGDHPRVLLPVIAGIFLLTASLMFVLVPRDLRPADSATRKPRGLRVVADMVRDPRVRTVSLLTLVGSVMYGQFFSAFAIHITHVTDSPTVRGAYYTMNAVIIVAGQVLVTRLTNRALGRGHTPGIILCVGIAVFGVSFLLLALPGPSIALTFLAVGVFATAEMVFSPMVSTAYAQLGGDRPMVEVFNFRQVNATLGESLGGFAGGALFTTLFQHRLGPAYWAGAALIGLATAAATAAFHRREGRPAITTLPGAGKEA
ncbi:MFS transporter [Streptomyces sp. NPDC007205]|uniref:MFS transporter n=1 Tax=Streptomyces sp. NPDC007205 TaxID=3154316 RepID=UPI0033F29878